MFNQIAKSCSVSMRSFFLNWRILSIILLTYIALLSMIFVFGATSLAVLWQVIVTFAAILLIPILFFLFQAMCVSFTIDGMKDGMHSSALLSRSFQKLWALLITTLVIGLIAYGIYYGVNALESHLTEDGINSVSEEIVSSVSLTTEVTAQATQERWLDGGFNIFSGLRFLLFGVAFPLITIHLWIALARKKLRVVIKESPHIVLHAFGLSSLVTYLLGMIIFALIPYYLLFTRTRSGREWVEIGLLGGRVLFAAIFILIGWVLTLGSLSILQANSQGNLQESDGLHGRGSD